MSWRCSGANLQLPVSACRLTSDPEDVSPRPLWTEAWPSRAAILDDLMADLQARLRNLGSALIQDQLEASS